jgi:hypothetical protein
MNHSMKTLINKLVCRAAGWAARFLAVASVFLLGRSGEAAAMVSDFQESGSVYVDQGSGTQVSYVQLGFKDGEDWPPPRPE